MRSTRQRLSIIALVALVVCGCVVRDGKFYFSLPSNGQVVNPIKKREFRVLIVENKDDRPTLSPARRAILTSQAVRDFMKQHCSKGPDGITPEFRCLDACDDASGEAEHWRATLARQRPGTPYYYVENEKTGAEGMLPEDEDRFLSILKPFTAGE